MEYTISLLNRAKFELADAVDWYNNQRDGLGNMFAIAVQNKLDVIQSHPRRYPSVRNKFKEVSLKKFPYAIIYFIEKIVLLLFTQSSTTAAIQMISSDSRKIIFQLKSTN